MTGQDLEFMFIDEISPRALLAALRQRGIVALSEGAAQNKAELKWEIQRRLHEGESLRYRPPTAEEALRARSVTQTEIGIVFEIKR